MTTMEKPQSNRAKTYNRFSGTQDHGTRGTNRDKFITPDLSDLPPRDIKNITGLLRSTHGMDLQAERNEDMKKSLREMVRVLKPNKYAVIVIGNATYLGQEIKTVEFIIGYAERIGLKLIKNIDKIIFGLYNVMQKENILIFQKVGHV